MPSAIILIANGTEVNVLMRSCVSFSTDAQFLSLTVASQEMEFTIVYDTLVRAGIECTSAFVPSASEIGLASTGGWGVRDVLVTCSRGEQRAHNGSSSII
jgi:hypothetical protein